LLNQLAAVSF